MQRIGTQRTRNYRTRTRDIQQGNIEYTEKKLTNFEKTVETVTIVVELITHG
jgi:hypothetical protein